MENLNFFKKNTLIKVFFLISLFALLISFNSLVSYGASAEKSDEPITLYSEEGSKPNRVSIKIEAYDGEIHLVGDPSNLVTIQKGLGSPMSISAAGGTISKHDEEDPERIKIDFADINDGLDFSSNYTITFPAGTVENNGGSPNQQNLIYKFRVPVGIESSSIDTDYSNDTYNITVNTSSQPSSDNDLGCFTIPMENYFIEFEGYNGMTSAVPTNLFNGFIGMESSPKQNIKETLAVTSSAATEFNHNTSDGDNDEILKNKRYLSIIYAREGKIDPQDPNCNEAFLYYDILYDAMMEAPIDETPQLSSPRDIILYRYNEVDSNGYDAALVVEFDEQIFINSEDNEFLAKAININLMGEWLNLLIAGFDSEIYGKKLIAKFNTSGFSDASQFSLTIPKGTIKNNADNANHEIKLLENFILPTAGKLALNQLVIDGDSQPTLTTNSLTAHGEIDLYPEIEGTIYSEFIEYPETDVLKFRSISDFSGANTLEFEPLPIYTKEYELVNEDYRVHGIDLVEYNGHFWITNFKKSGFNPSTDIAEGYIYSFSVGADEGPVILDLTYDNGIKNDLTDDEYLIRFDEDINVSETDASDFLVKINVGESSEELLVAGDDYTIKTKTGKYIIFNFSQSATSKIGAFLDANPSSESEVSFTILDPATFTPLITNGNTEINGRITYDEFYEDDESQPSEVEFISIAYDTGSDPDAAIDDIIKLNFSGNINNKGNVSNYTVEIDNNSDGTFKTVDYSLTFLDEHVSIDQSGTTVSISIGGSIHTLVDQLENAMIRVTLSNGNGFSPNILETSLSSTCKFPSRNALLSSLKLTNSENNKEIDIAGFDPNVFSYSIPVTYSEYVSMAENENGVLFGIPQDESSSRISTNDGNGGIICRVTTEDENLYKDYSVTLLKNPYLLKEINVGGNLITNFDPRTKNYTVNLPYGSTLPEVTYSLDSGIPGGIFVNDTESDGGNVRTITVTQLEAPHPKDVYVVTFVIAEEGGDSNTGSGNRYPSTTTTTNPTTGTTPTPATPYAGIPGGIDPIDPEPTKAKENIDNLLKGLATVKDKANARKALDNLNSTFENIDDIKKDLDEDEKRELDIKLKQLLEESKRLLNFIEEPEEAKKLANNLLPNISKIYKDEEKKTKDTFKKLKDMAEIANKVTEKSGEIKLKSSNLEFKDNQVIMKASIEDVKEAVERSKKTKEELKDSLKGLVGEGFENSIKSSVTLTAPDSFKKSGDIGTVLDKDTMDALKKSEVDEVKVNMGPVSYVLDKDFIGARSNFSIKFSARKEGELKQGSKEFPNGAKPVGSPVFDLNSRKDEKLDNKFEKPIIVKLNLDNIDGLNTNGFDEWDFENLTPYRQEVDENGEIKWVPVNCFYDKATHSLVIPRGHLSKYTLLKSTKTYSDIEDSWAKNEIKALKGKGVTSSDELFSPKSNVTREEFAGWIANAYGLSGDGSKLEFEDMDKDSPYYEAVAAVYNQGIIRGRDDKTFDPEGEVSREEMAVMIAGALDNFETTVNPETVQLAKYEVDMPDWAKDSAEKVLENGIVDETYFGSAENVSKEEAASIIYNLYR